MHDACPSDSATEGRVGITLRLGSRCDVRTALTAYAGSVRRFDGAAVTLCESPVGDGRV